MANKMDDGASIGTVEIGRPRRRKVDDSFTISNSSVSAAAAAAAQPNIGRKRAGATIKKRTV